MVNAKRMKELIQQHPSSFSSALIEEVFNLTSKLKPIIDKRRGEWERLLIIVAS